MLNYTNMTAHVLLRKLTSTVLQSVQLYTSINYSGFDCRMENIVDPHQLASTEAS